jgi:RND family efflux transporter MFP subunit
MGVNKPVSIIRTGTYTLSALAAPQNTANSPSDSGNRSILPKPEDLYAEKGGALACLSGRFLAIYMCFKLLLFPVLIVASTSLLVSSCAARRAEATSSEAVAPSVGTTPVKTQPVAQHLTVSSELIPFQETDIYAKEAGYVKQLFVDYGSRVRSGQLLAVLEVPELEAQLQQDQAAISAQNDEVIRAGHEVNRVKAQHNAVHLQFERLQEVAKSRAGLVAQQEVDDAQGKDLAAESQWEAAQGALQAAQSQLAVAKAKLVHDQALYSYSRITAPFDGVVTQRFANLGALMQAGTSSNQATPLVRLSQESLYRLVIPVPESDVRYIKTGDPVAVRVPSLNQSLAGKVARFSVDVKAETRTMHTEVDVPNKNHELVPGLFAEAMLTLNQHNQALVVPLQAIDHTGGQNSVLVVDAAHRIQRRPIAVGIETANYSEVLSGLQEGEQVIISDRSGLKPGQLVRSQPVPAMVYETSNGEQ